MQRGMYSDAAVAKGVEPDEAAKGAVPRRSRQRRPKRRAAEPFPEQHNQLPASDAWHAVLQGMADACSGPLSLLSRCSEPAGLREGARSRERLRLRLDRYGIEERPILGDGNCQFASVSDQLYGTPRHHPVVRAAVVKRLQSDPERYSPYVQGQSFEEYLEEISACGAWGDHVTLQALADTFGLRVVLVTSFVQDCIVEIQPCKEMSTRVLWLSFLAELHYSSLYPKGEVPVDTKTSCVIA